jgi:predicted nucleotidyltransferase
MISLRSNLRRKLLTHFYVNRAVRTHVRQLARELDVDSTNLSRELARLEREGLLRVETEGRQTYYSINPQYPYLEPVFSLLEGTIGVKPSMTHALERVDGIASVWLYGSFAKDEEDAASDIDLLIIGQPDAANLAEEVMGLEKVIKREINYTVLTPQELRRRLVAHDAFLMDVWKGKRVQLIDHEQDKATAN